MSDSIVIDVDRDGWTRALQLQIAQHYKNGGGEGYRLAGPKYNGSSKNLLRCELDERDAREIRTLLNAVFPLAQSPSRADVLREAAGHADQHAARAVDRLIRLALTSLADELLRLADEAGQEKATPTGEAPPADITIYRASHDSIVMGLYTSREAARQHCETLIRREVGDTVFLGWVPDDGSDDAPEELCTGEGVECTGYVVTPLTAASKYDEEADE